MEINPTRFQARKFLPPVTSGFREHAAFIAALFG
jgi:hypothetical protein